MCGCQGGCFFCLCPSTAQSESSEEAAVPPNHLLARWRLRSTHTTPSSSFEPCPNTNAGYRCVGAGGVRGARLGESFHKITMPGVGVGPVERGPALSSLAEVRGKKKESPTSTNLFCFNPLSLYFTPF